MGARDLVAVVHAQKDGETRVFSPGDDVPTEWAKVITNPKAWAGNAAADTSGDDEAKAKAEAEAALAAKAKADEEAAAARAAADAKAAAAKAPAAAKAKA